MCTLIKDGNRPARPFVSLSHCQLVSVLQNVPQISQLGTLHLTTSSCIFRTGPVWLTLKPVLSLSHCFFSTHTIVDWNGLVYIIVAIINPETSTEPRRVHFLS